MPHPRAKYDEREQALLAKGICMDCAKRPRRGTSPRCAECLSRCAKRNRDQYQVWKAAGVCTWCGGERLTGYVSCEQCVTDGRNYFRVRREERLLRDQARRRRLMDDVFGHYGNVCACCGESEREFLTIDHVNNDGGHHRRKYPASGGGVGLYLWIKRHGYPDDLQLLCMNCNWGKMRCRGICPHKQVSGYELRSPIEDVPLVWQ